MRDKFAVCVLNTVEAAVDPNSWACTCMPRTTLAFSSSEVRNISIHCSWPVPKTTLRSFYMALLWTVEICLRMLPVGRMSKALLHSLKMQIDIWIFYQLFGALWHVLCKRITLTRILFLSDFRIYGLYEKKTEGSVQDKQCLVKVS